MQYLPYLSEAGFEPTVASLFDAKYLEAMYSGRRNPVTLVKYLHRRLKQLKTETDLIWLEKEALPWVPWPLERMLWPRNIPIVADYDDAIFHRYDQNSNALIRFGLGRKIGHVMATAHTVFAGNEYLAQHAQRAGAHTTEIVPTVVDTDAYKTQQADRADGRPTIGWIGTPETWNNFARNFVPILRATALQENALCRVVGAEPKSRTEMPFEYLPWNEETEISLIKGMDVGLMPLPDTPWTRGKCGYKLIQYMACGLPVVASPVGVNSQIIEHGVNGFLAETDEEWQHSITLLLKDAALRSRMGAAGLRAVEERFSLKVWAPRVRDMLSRTIHETGK